ncbi:MAG TPA: N-methyl-L-tryptophan oxidase, partial [Candidatus Dormibacteraeota bacterium]|nr:N-methyl-L-tryptophan oxidase [Candidatus Dormibacteraeota bacterium]
FERFRPGHDRGSSHGDTRIFRTAYFESPEYVPLLQRAKQLWLELETETGADLLTMTGGLTIGSPDCGLVTGVLASAERHVLAHRVFDARQMQKLYPQHRLVAGEVAVFEDEAGFLRPERSVAAAAARAEALGARVMVESEVTSIEASSSGVVVDSSSGRFAAGRALVAAGPWTAKLLPGLGLPLKVERQVQAWLAIDDPAAFSPTRFPIFIREIDGGRYRYGFPTTDGHSVKLGVHHEGSESDPDSVDREVTEADLQPVMAFARDALPDVSDRVIDACTCMYTNTPDERFMVISPAQMPGVSVLSACSGHGFKFAPVIGDLVARSIVDGSALPSIIRTS